MTFIAALGWPTATVIIGTLAFLTIVSCVAVWQVMATGRSVVATDVPGAREALGEAGAVVPIEDPGQLADAMAERLLDPKLAAEEGRAGRARAERYFDVRRTTAQVAEVYDAVIGTTA